MPKPTLTPAAMKLVLTAKQAPLVLTSPRLDNLLEERMLVAAKFSQLEAKKKKLDADILAFAIKKTGDRDRPVETGEFVVTPVNAENISISAELLLKLGVRASIIEKAKKHTPYSYPRITKKKVADGTTADL